MFYKAKSNISKDICICIIDDTKNYDSWMQQIVKNIADYTITNCTSMGYDIYTDTNTDRMLKTVSSKYKTAILMSAGNEFINGDKFFKSIPNDFFLIAHILDGSEGYYGLHPQCMILNLEKYNELGNPNIGEEMFFSSHVQNEPIRSSENVHDDYTPLYINKGNKTKKYKHKMYGWNLISKALDAGYTIENFNNDLRDGKYYYYTNIDNSNWVYRRYNYCLANHTFDENTGSIAFPRPYTSEISHLVHPAAGWDWLSKLKIHGYNSNTRITFFDYNEAALDMIYQRSKEYNFKCDFINIDVVAEPESLIEKIPPSEPVGVVIHMSNIFSYEGTAALMPLKYRVEQENKLIRSVQRRMPICVLDFDQRAIDGFVPYKIPTGLAKDLEIIEYQDLMLPSWHY